MPDIHDPQVQLALAFGTGVFLHIALYRRGEWDLFVPRITTLYGILWAGLIGWIQKDNWQNLNSLNLDSLSPSIKSATLILSSHVSGIALSMVTYRLFFHSLRSFPGPFWARVSNFYLTFLTSKHLHLYEEVEDLHEIYGDYVRVGPSQLSITDPLAMDAIYSAKSPCLKGPWYNILHPRASLNMLREKTEHARRRKVFDRGFGAKALRDYEPRVANYTSQLLAQIAATSGKPINVTDWFNFYSFDVMGDLAFGKSFNMLRDGIKHYFMTCLHADLTNVGYLSHIPWMFPFLKITPILNSEHKKFWAFCGQQVKERRAMTPDRPDIFSWVLEDYEANKKTKADKLNLEGDAYLIVVAGSDTTAATLTSLFYELSLHPSVVTTLQSEIDAYFAQTPAIDHISLSKLSYLDAVINETLRLHPPVPSGLQRQVPREGMFIGKTWIPGNSIVQVPLHTVFRDKRLFRRPTEFIPERWTSQRELVIDASSFAPFSNGLYSCIGKHLALMELRYVISQITHLYTPQLAPGQDPAAFLNGKRDTFTLALGGFKLVFDPREKGAGA